MIRRMISALSLFGLLLAGLATSAHAQDIMGLSLRPTDAVPGSPGRGTVDITSSNGEGNYQIRVDMSGAADSLNLDDHDGATAWVVWAIDMDGVRHNIGSLDEDLLLEDAAVSYMVARVYVTAEEDPRAVQPSEPLFSVTLRQVQEVDTIPADEPADDGSGDEAADEGEDMADESTEGDQAEEGETSDEEGDSAMASDEEETPAELPTTGGPISDMLMLVAIAAALLFGGMRLRAFRGV